MIGKDWSRTTPEERATMFIDEHDARHLTTYGGSSHVVWSARDMTKALADAFRACEAETEKRCKDQTKG